VTQLRPVDFELVPVDLLDAAIIYGEWIAARGFSIEIEPYDLEFPNTPLLKATRGMASYFHEVSSAVDLSRAEDWVKYGRASKAEVRYVAAVSTDSDIPQRTLMKLRQLGVGLDIVDGRSVQSLIAPHDLSLDAEFPELTGRLVVSLGSARDLLEQGHWKEAFEDACLALETAARIYMAKAVRAKRVRFVRDNGSTANYTEEQIMKKTLGQLAGVYDELAQPTQAESRVAQSLRRVNPHRVTVAHFKHESGARESELRSTVGKELIVIVNAMKLLGQ